MIDPQNPDFSNTPASPARPANWYAPQNASAPPAVSVITPFRNTGAVFHETAACVLGQSLQQWEWIIVDDCSDSPESLAILDEYRAKDPRIRVDRAEHHLGLPGARNRGVAAARAAYVFLLDSDDLLEPTALEKQWWFLECRPHFAFARGYTVGFAAQTYFWCEGFHRRNRFLATNCVPVTSMIRRQTYLDVGGMSEEIRGGMEDWDFWLKCAAAGSWGGTIPEFLDWYRRRPANDGTWTNLDGPNRMQAFRESLRQKYPELFAKGLPRPQPLPFDGSAQPGGASPFTNSLARQPGVKRLLLIVPYFELGGADKFNLDLIRSLQEEHNYQVTVAATLPGRHPWRHNFEALTPDVFTLNTFLPVREHARFLEYLIRSRDYDAVLVANSQAGYQMLPFLRTACAKPAFADYLHMEQEDWRSGGYARDSLDFAPLLDVTIVASQHLKDWMVARGGDASRISVCTINVDPQLWDRSRFDAPALRAKYGVPPDLPVLAYAARFCDQKRPELLAKVVKRLKARGARFVCLAAGGGELFSNVEDFVKANRLDELRLLGTRSNQEVREILAIADIYFMPSKMEGIALAIYEAMAMGTVPVSAAVGGQSELVTPDCGVLVPPAPDEAEAYTAALLDLLSNPEKRHNMALRCRERIRAHFSLRDMGARMAALLRQAPASRPFHLATALETWQNSPAGQAHRRDSVAMEDRSPIGFPNETEYLAMLSLGARLACGNLLVLPQLLKQSGIGWPEVRSSLAMALSPRRFVSKTRNLFLLARVLASEDARHLFLTEFDAGYYRFAYDDVRRARVIPILHYALIGHAEHRQPFELFDDYEFSGVPPGINPLLWRSLHPDS